nr:DUF4058 family protein [Fortiea sp. LEGE XX443]
MNPYLELLALWHEFHNRLIDCGNL